MASVHIYSNNCQCSTFAGLLVIGWNACCCK